MKITSISHMNLCKEPNKEIIEENIEHLSSARYVLAVDDSDDEDLEFKISGDRQNKWRINSYGVPSYWTKKLKNTNAVTLDYFTISSNICNINNIDDIEYSGLQLGEIENSIFMRLLCYGSPLSGDFFTPNSLSEYKQIFKTINMEFNRISNDYYPKYIVCDTYILNKILKNHPDFYNINGVTGPCTSGILYDNEPIEIIVNNTIGSSSKSSLILAADIIGPMHVKGGLKEWKNDETVIFTESIGMAILAEKGIRRISISK